MVIGTYVEHPLVDPPLRVFCHDPRLRPFAATDAFLAFLAEHVGPVQNRQAERRGAPARIPARRASPHVLACGITGGGKSTALIHLAQQQLERGHSLMVIDPVNRTVDQLLLELVARRFPAASVTIIDARRKEAVPGWNPFLSGLPLSQIASGFVSLVQRSSTTTGPRMWDLLHDACLVAGAHSEPSPYELLSMITNERYRSQLLRLPPPPSDDPVAVRQAWNHLRYEHGGLSPSERKQTETAAANKIRELIRSPFLRGLVSSRANTVSLQELWRQQHVLLIALNAADLGDDAIRIATGLLIGSLAQTASRMPGPVPVSCFIDELPVFQQFADIESILARARAQNLSMWLVCQHFSQLSDRLQDSIRTNAGTWLLFRQGPQDARPAAASLAIGTEPRVVRAVATVDREDRQTGLPQPLEWRHPLLGADGRPLRVRADVWQRLPPGSRVGHTGLRMLQVLARAGGISRVYVRSPRTGAPVEIREYVAGHVRGEFWISGPSLQLVCALPRPRFTRVDTWTEADAARAWERCLLELPTGHCVLRVPEGRTGVVRVDPLETPRIDPAQVDRFLQASARSNAQAEPEATMQWRQARVERIAAGGSFDGSAGEGVSDDASID